MRVNSSPRSSSARAIRSARSESPNRVFSASVGLTSSTIAPYAPAKPTPRRTSKHSSAPAKSGSASSTTTAEVDQRRPELLQHRGHRGVDRQAAEVAAPGDPQPGDRLEAEP